MRRRRGQRTGGRGSCGPVLRGIHAAPGRRGGTVAFEVTTDKAPVYPRLLDELLPETCHVDAAKENNRIETDHGRLKARLRPMHGMKRLRSVQTISTGHALVQNIRRGHYELATDTNPQLRLAAVFTELAAAI
ncbi:hypothetical protein Franean1_6782 [Parafrankia sp. EAN1pec]|nr:hypothetical protein Franean1_6782 [Frankia sp. EAN1pec]